MNNKFKNWLAMIGTKNLIAISVLVVLVAVVGIGVAVKNNQKTGGGADVPKDEPVGLQVEENVDDAEGDSIDFEDFISGDGEDEKTDTDNDGIVDKEDDDDDNDGIPDAKDEDDNNDGTPDVEGGLDEEASTDKGELFGPLF